MMANDDFMPVELIEFMDPYLATLGAIFVSRYNQTVERAIVVADPGGGRWSIFLGGDRHGEAYQLREDRRDYAAVIGSTRLEVDPTSLTAAPDCGDLLVQGDSYAILFRPRGSMRHDGAIPGLISVPTDEVRRDLERGFTRWRVVVEASDRSIILYERTDTSS